MQCHEEWRLEIFIDLQARLLLNLCDQKITPDIKIRKNMELCKTIWSDYSLIEMLIRNIYYIKFTRHLYPFSSYIMSL
ncbi:hypothetical protein FNYG_06166 [Fusarium nygamai]|uniref:Uncharacterized protein n=1 Tax=Gibberella nygamai TaxID=42673 RepID=A0A2K0WE59_GIBNY|nr:hypothetical protein FNYG_06166 [Fusarium nygamai]